MLFLCCVCSAHAQYEYSANKRGIKYQGEVNVGYNIVVSKKYDIYAAEIYSHGGAKEEYRSSSELMDWVMLETVHGIRLSSHFFAGIGVKTLASTHNSRGYLHSFKSILLPMFVHVKYYPIQHVCAPYLAADLGYSIWLNRKPFGNNGGLYGTLGIGLNYKYLNFGLGYQMQQWSYLYTHEKVNHDNYEVYEEVTKKKRNLQGALYLKVGVQF